MTVSSCKNILADIEVQLRASKLRSALAMLAITIAIATVICVAAVLNGLSRAVQSTIDLLGPHTFFVSRLPPIVPYGKFSDQVRRRRFLEWPEPMDFQQLCPSIGIATAFATRAFFFGEKVRVSYGRESVERLILRGVEPDYAAAIPAFSGPDGRFISRIDEERAAPVAVIGRSVARSLFPHLDPIGKRIRLNDSMVRVIGVFQEDSGLWSVPGADDFVVIPLSFFRKRFPESKEVVIAFTVRPGSEEEQAKDEVEQALRRIRHVAPGAPSDFDVVSPEFIRVLWKQLTRALVALTAAVTCVGLGVGGIGVMNVMLISVSERTGEIGIRRAVGASRWDIRLQFLSESVVLTLCGGIAGILFGWFAVWAMRAFTISLPTLLAPGWAIAGAASSIALGLLFGYFPASRAAHLDPIECLRHEK
jgi:putative ABC transport system permease protein